MNAKYKLEKSIAVANYVLCLVLGVVLFLSSVQYSSFPFMSLNLNSLAIIIIITIIILVTYYGNLRIGHDLQTQSRRINTEGMIETIHKRKSTITEIYLFISKSDSAPMIETHKEKLFDEVQNLLQDLERFKDRL